MTQPRVHLRAEAIQQRNGKTVFRGDPFTAPAEEAADLVALRFASVVDHSVDEEETKAPVPIQTSPRPTKPTIAKKVMVAKKVEKPKSGRYARRDLRSDD